MATLVLRQVLGVPLTNAQVDGNFTALNNFKLELDGSQQMTGKLRLVQSNSSRASLNFSPGTVVPTAPSSGDMWNTNGVLKFYNGTTTGDVFTSITPISTESLDATAIGKSLLALSTPAGDRFIKVLSNGTTQLRNAADFRNDLEISTITGFTGSQGAVGFTGSAGSAGPTGFTGSGGAVGFTGSQGATGFTGSGISSSSNTQLNSLGVNTPASGVAGEIRATDNITAYYTSDRRLKENIVPILNALDKLQLINGVHFDWTPEHIKNYGGEDGYFVRKNDVGVIAQDVNFVLPEAVATREDGFMAVRYEKLIPLLIQAIKELKAEVDLLKSK